MPSRKEIEIAAQIARTSTVPLDRLPYTEQFEILYQAFCDQLKREITQHDFWQALLSARKRGLVGSRRKRKENK